MEENKTISEQEFRQLCDEVSVNSALILKTRIPKMKEETALLQEVFLRLCRRLGIDPASAVEPAEDIPADALTCIFEINEIMCRRAHPSFNHSKIIKELLREALRGTD